MKVGDAHCHVNPVKGLGPRELAKRFKKANGWFIGLVNLLSWSYDVTAIKPEDYRKVYDITLKSAELIREEGIKVAIILGPHPAEFTTLVEKGVKPEEAYNIMVRAYEIAALYISEGKASGLGEVGRPHWPVSHGVLNWCNRILDRVLELASDLDCIVHLHLEETREETIEDIHSRVKKYRARKVILHHIKSRYVRKAFEKGLYASVPARSRDLIEALKHGSSFVIESDYLDDPKRPGAVVAPWSIYRTFKRLIDGGYLSEAEAERILVDNIKTLYDLE
ncbi:MAG: deoxyribonuclease [Thermoprotei archaeon]|nr:MAG: deoxyribonuclease [Thermoprotei archaeon]